METKWRSTQTGSGISTGSGWIRTGDSCSHNVFSLVVTSLAQGAAGPCGALGDAVADVLDDADAAGKTFANSGRFEAYASSSAKIIIKMITSIYTSRKAF